MRKDAADAGGEHQVHGLEADVVALGARLADGVDQHAEQHHRRDHQHQRRQAVGHQRDPHGCRPAAGLHGHHPSRSTATSSATTQHDAEHADAEHPLGPAGAGRRPSTARLRERQQDGQGHQGVHVSRQRLVVALLLVQHLFVGAAVPSDEAVLEVVLHLVVPGRSQLR